MLQKERCSTTSAGLAYGGLLGRPRHTWGFANGMDGKAIRILLNEPSVNEASPYAKRPPSSPSTRPLFSMRGTPLEKKKKKAYIYLAVIGLSETTAPRW